MNLAGSLTRWAGDRMAAALAAGPLLWGGLHEDRLLMSVSSSESLQDVSLESLRSAAVMMGWVARGLDRPMVVDTLLLLTGCRWEMVDNLDMLAVMLARGPRPSNMTLTGAYQPASRCALRTAAAR